MKMRISILFISAGIFVAPLAAHAQTFTVDRVIDGDTFKLSNNDTVSLIGIDAPEDKRNLKVREDSERTGQSIDDIIKIGKEVTAWVKKNFEGKQVFVQYDVQEEDKYGNKLGYVYLHDEVKIYEGFVSRQLTEDFREEWWQKPKRAKFIFVNGTIVRAGYATPNKVAPNVKYADLLDKFYEEAKKKYSGLWDMDWPERPCIKEGENIGGSVGCFLECCDGLMPMFDQVVKNKCRKFSVPGSSGICSHCGNDICESKYLEDDCNCPEDCE